MTGAPTYDRVGLNYAAFRREDPRIAARIRAALGDARSVVNVGAGSGSYEPADLQVIAVEPSSVTIAQRPAGAAPAVQGMAEALPLAGKSADAAMAVFTIHHWSDLAAGLAEMRRVARKRIVLLTIDAAKNAKIWTLAEYFPAAMRAEEEKMPSMRELEALLPGAEIEAVPMPSRCRDEFTSALWDRPELFLDPAVLRASSLWHSLPPRRSKRARSACEPTSRAVAGTSVTAGCAPCPSSTSVCESSTSSCDPLSAPNCIKFPTCQSGNLMQLRRAEESDAAAVVALWTQGYVTEGEGGRIEPYVEDDFRETARRGRVLVVELDGVVVGVVALLAPSAPGRAVARRGEAELVRLVVSPSTRRRGVGRALTRRCAQIARQEGWPAIALWSREYQTAAHRLYESLGYERRPERDDTDATGHARLVFRLLIQPLPEPPSNPLRLAWLA